MKQKQIPYALENIMFGLSVVLLILFLFLYVIKGALYEVLGLVKPITLVQYTGFLAFALFLNKIRFLFLKMSKKSLNLLIVIGFLFITGTLFEMLWSFNYWFSTYTLDVASGAPENPETLDSAIYFVPPDSVKYNLYENMPLITSAKKNLLFFMMSLYFVYFLNKLDSKRKTLAA
ncbi:MAG: hypothetical protein V1831_01650 [Candidatus Woesearchaeota archaeon]